MFSPNVAYESGFFARFFFLKRLTLNQGASAIPSSSLFLCEHNEDDDNPTREVCAAYVD